MAGPVLEARNLVKHFPVKRGFLSRQVAVVRAVDDSAAKRVMGYLKSLVLDDPSNTVPGWVVVCATSYPAAIRAADRSP